MVIEGDFVPGVVASKNPLKPVSGYNVFPFPAIGNTPNYVEGGGDMLMAFKDNPAIRALVQYLATGAGPDDLGEAGRVHRSREDGRGERVSGRDHARDGDARSARRRCSGSTCPTSSRPRSAARSGRASSRSSRTS